MGNWKILFSVISHSKSKCCGEKKPDELSVWYSCSKSEGKVQVTNTTVELTKAQKVIKALQ